MIDLPAEVDVLLTAIKQSIRTRQKVRDAHVIFLLQLTCLRLKFLADAREERRRAVMRMFPLVDNLSVKHFNIKRVSVFPTLC